MAEIQAEIEDADAPWPHRSTDQGRDWQPIRGGYISRAGGGWPHDYVDSDYEMRPPSDQLRKIRT